MKPVLLNSINDYPKSGLGRITTASNQQVHEVLNSDYTFTFDILRTDKLFKKVKEEMIVATSVSKSDTDFFYIKSLAHKSSGVETVTCNHLTILSNENYMRGTLTIDGKTVKQVITEMTSKLDLPSQQLTYSTDIDQTIGKTDISYTNANPGQIMIGTDNSLASVLDARLVRKGKTLKLTSLNTGNYIDLRKGKNIAGVDIQRSIDNLTTSIVPFYKMKNLETSDNGEIPTVDKYGWTNKVVDGGQVECAKLIARVYTDANTLINNYALVFDTDWKTDRQRTKSGVTQYRVATNMWVLSTDVKLIEGTIGDTIGYPNDVKPADTVPENQLQYGPEVKSLRFDTYKLPHRKYVDYSDRVENIPDLIDVSSQYFIENPKADQPTYTISIDVVNAGQKRVQEANIGDIARIFDPDYNLNSEETIVERTFDPDLMRNTSVKAGQIQQTIFRYLDKRITDANTKTSAIGSQTTADIKDTQNVISVNQIQANAANDQLKNQIDASEQAALDKIESVKADVHAGQVSISNFMNSGGTNKIRWVPNLAEATQMEIHTDYGYWLLDDRGAGFHKTDGTVIAGLSADGRVYADSLKTNFLTGTYIDSGTIVSGDISSSTITGSKITGTSSIQLTDNGVVSTSIAGYGISTPALTVRQIDGVVGIATTGNGYIWVGSAKLSSDSSGHLLVNGAKVLT